MIIKDAQFVISNTDYKKCPQDSKPEYAFIGRSNVGKSSLINMITNRKGLALASSTPGKTQLINHFIINDDWYLVDLPGYGYAQRGKEGRDKITKIINNYILNRTDLTCLFLLIDCRHEAQKIDLEFMEWLGENSIPFAIVFTKTDKVGKVKLSESVEKYKLKLNEFWEELPPIFYTSSSNKTGKDEILSYIEEINKTLDKNG